MSKIEVNKIGPQCGTTLTVGCGAGQTVAVDANTVTLGRCGGTVALASGASQTGFGRTGTVDWQTSIQTSASFTAVNGQGFFVDTSSNAVTANLPAGSVGAIVAFKDYAQNFDTNSLTISANGSEKIEGQTFDLELSTEGQAVTLVYGDATKGWQAVNSNEIVNSPTHVAATGGSVSTVCTNFKVHTFTSPGTFCVSAGNGPLAVVDYQVIAGGGGGGSDANSSGGIGVAGGGAGGFREAKVSGTSGCWSASPLASATSIPVSIQGYPIVVGAGGAAGPGSGGSASRGSDSTFSTITSTGGGGGRGEPNSADNSPGGSGGGGTYNTAGGTGNTPSVSPSQGNNGEAGLFGGNYPGGGGGGAIEVGGTDGDGQGGDGATSSINGTPTTRAGGGGGGFLNGVAGSPGGSGGGGKGGDDSPGGGNGTAGSANTGGGGGGGSGHGGTGAAGGSGVVIIRYKFQ